MGIGTVTSIEIRSMGEDVEAFVFGRTAKESFCRHYFAVSAASFERLMGVVLTDRFTDATVGFDGETLVIVADAVPFRVEPVTVNLFIQPEEATRAAITRGGTVRWHEDVSDASVERLTDVLDRSGVVLTSARHYAGCFSMVFSNRQASVERRLSRLDKEWRKVYRITLDAGNLAMQFLAKGIADDCYQGTAMSGDRALALVSEMLSTATPNLNDFITEEMPLS